MKKNIRVTEPSAEMQMKIRRARIAIASQKRRTMECPYCHHNTIIVFEDTTVSHRSVCSSIVIWIRTRFSAICLV